MGKGVAHLVGGQWAALPQGPAGRPAAGSPAPVGQTRMSAAPKALANPPCLPTPWLSPGHGWNISWISARSVLCPPGGLYPGATHLLAPSQVQGRVAAALPVPCLPMPLRGALGTGAALHGRGWLPQLHGQLLLLRVNICVTAGLRRGWAHGLVVLAQHICPCQGRVD